MDATKNIDLVTQWLERWPVLNYQLYGNSLAAWTMALTISIAMGMLLSLVRRVITSRAIAFAEKTENTVDNLVVELLQGITGLLPWLFSFYVGCHVLHRSQGFDAFLGKALIIVVLIQGGMWGSKLASYVLTGYVKRHRGEDSATLSALGLLTFLSKVLVWAVVLLLGLDNLGVDITALIAGLGVGGIAVALAVQNVLGDLLASLSIILDKPFEVGDFIIVDSLMGTVERIGIKTTRVKSITGEQLIFSNSDLLGSRVKNFKRMQERRVVFQLGVTYQTSRDKLAAIPDLLKQIVSESDRVRFDRAHFKGFGPSSLDFEIVYYVLDPDYALYMDLQQAMNLEIIERFSAEQIEFAYPTQTLFLERTESDAAPPSAA